MVSLINFNPNKPTPTKHNERLYLARKRRVNKFYSSTKLKGVRRELNEDEHFNALFYKGENGTA